jgi:hypothetical protein
MPKKSGLRIADEIGYRLSILAGAVGLFGGVYLFDSSNTSQTIILSFGLSLVAMIGTALLIKLIIR